MYLQAWTPTSDLVLIGDLIASSGVLDLSLQGQHLMQSLQASELQYSRLCIMHGLLTV